MTHLTHYHQLAQHAIHAGSSRSFTYVFLVEQTGQSTGDSMHLNITAAVVEVTKTRWRNINENN